MNEAVDEASWPRPLALVVMAKAPVAGLAKTRLAPALGAEGAAALAQRLLQHTLAQAASAGFDRLLLCVTPDEPHPLLLRAAQAHGAHWAPQGAGDLGQRMRRAFDRAWGAQGDGTGEVPNEGPNEGPNDGAHDSANGSANGNANDGAHGSPSPRPAAVLLVGTDAPALDRTRLREAAAALRTHETVVVPALDGGYALIGLARQPCAPAALFDGVAWSTGAVLAQTLTRLQALGLRTAVLAPVADIDEPADLVHLPPALRDASAGAAAIAGAGRTAP